MSCNLLGDEGRKAVASPAGSDDTDQSGRLGLFAGVWPRLVDIGLHTSGVQAMWLHGSRTWGTHHENSDLDLVYLLGTAADTLELRRALASAVHYEARSVDYLTDRPCEYWEYGGVELGVHILGVTELRDRMERLFTSVDDLLAEQSFAQHVVVEARPVFDHIGILAWVAQHVRPYPDLLRQQVVEQYLARLERKLLWWRRRPVWKGAFEQVADLGVILHEVAGCHYALNGEFCMDGLKQYPQDLRRLLPDLSSLVPELCRVVPEDHQGLHKRALVAGVVGNLRTAHEEQQR